MIWFHNLQELLHDGTMYEDSRMHFSACAWCLRNLNVSLKKGEKNNQMTETTKLK